MARGTFDEMGREIPDPRPVEVPTGLRASPSLQDEIRRYIRSEMSLLARNMGHETFEEANDFITDDELDEFLDDTRYTVRDLLPESGDVDASEAPKGPSITPDPPGPDSGAQPPK